MSEQDISIAAMERTDPADRLKYLDEACAGDVELHARVEKLIEKSQLLGSFLDLRDGFRINRVNTRIRLLCRFGQQEHDRQNGNQCD